MLSLYSFSVYYGGLENNRSCKLFSPLRVHGPFTTPHVDLSQLLLLHFARSVVHRSLRLLILRECDDIPETLCPRHQHNNSVEPHCDSTVRGCPVPEGIQQKSELLLRLAVSDPQEPEHALLCLLVMDPDRASADLIAVQNQVVRLRPDAGRILLHLVEILIDR